MEKRLAKLVTEYKPYGTIGLGRPTEEKMRSTGDVKGSLA
jgi:hypothetical protein